MQVQEIPRTAVRTGLKAARLPLSALETVVRRGRRDEAWPPNVLFGRVEAGVKQLAGSVLRDEELVTEGRLQAAKSDELQRAATLEAVAEQQREQADAEAKERRRQADERKREAEQRAKAQRQDAERRKAEQKRKADAEARRREQAAAKAKAAEQKAVAARKRDARATRVSAERQAVAEERKAVETRGEALDIEDRIEASKAVRKARA